MLQMPAARRPLDAAVAVHYSREDGGSVQDQLEYVPIDTTIGRIIEASGARRNSERRGRHRSLRARPETQPADESAFEDAIAAAVAAKRSVAVADLTFLIGGPGPDQRRLTDALIARRLAGSIDAFASWNTTANTIGTAIPEASP